jgi:hypothetical protein
MLALEALLMFRNIFGGVPGLDQSWRWDAAEFEPTKIFNTLR